MRKLIFTFLALSAIGIAFINILPGIKKEFLPPDKIVKIVVPSGATISYLLQDGGLATDTIAAILENAKGVYDLSKIVSGREIILTLANTDNAFKSLVYKIDSENQLIVEKLEDAFSAEVANIPYEVEIKETAGTVETSLYEAFLSQNLDPRLALALAEMFAWQVDFAADTRKGDQFKVIYESRLLKGEYVMPGKILAAKYINDGAEYRGYYFETENTKGAYYDEDGNSLQKQFLKSPLRYKYISSGYSYARVNPVTKKVAPHRGIDYAANYGTPAVSVGDGTVIQAGWNGPYGISVMIRHNDTYRTRYGHFQNLAKGIKIGAKVKQGQVVGYVGSTGESTGPHLHYEMHKFGSHVNPFRVEIPPGEPIADSDKQLFEEVKSKYNL